MRFDPILILAAMFALDPVVRAGLQRVWRIRHPGVRISILPIQFLVAAVAVLIYVMTTAPPTYMYMPHQEPAPHVETEFSAFEPTVAAGIVHPEPAEPAWSVVPDVWPEHETPPIDDGQAAPPRLDDVADQIEAIEDAVTDGEACEIAPIAYDTAEAGLASASELADQQSPDLVGAEDQTQRSAIVDETADRILDDGGLPDVCVDG